MLVHVDVPFIRYTSKNCLLLFLLRKNGTKEEKKEASQGSLRCKECNLTYRRSRSESKRYLEDIEDRRAKRVKADSHYPMSLLSPNSKKKRHKALRAKNKQMNEKLRSLSKKLEEYTVQLEEDQTSERTNFLSHVQQKDIDSVYQDAQEKA